LSLGMKESSTSYKKDEIKNKMTLNS